MGNQPNQQTFIVPSSIPTHIQSKHLGNLQRININSQSLLKKVTSYGDSITYHECLSKIQNRMKHFQNHEHIISIHSISKQQVQDLCSYGGHITIHLQDYQYDLHTLLRQKIKIMEHFQEEQIWQFMRKVVEGLIQIHDNGLKTVHVDGFSIILAKKKKDYSNFSWQDCVIKLIDGGISVGATYPRLLSLLNTNKLNEIDKKEYEMLTEELYMSPQLLEQLKKCNPQPNLSPKQDVFSLGMLVVSMCCLEVLDGYYNYQQLTFDYQNLIYKISKMVYSQDLKLVLAQMLEYHQEQRIGLVSLHEKLSRTSKNNQRSIPRKSAQKPRSSSTKILSQMLLTTSRNKSQRQTNKTVMTQKSNSSLQKSKLLEMNPNSSTLSLHSKNKILNSHQSSILPRNDLTNLNSQNIQKDNNDLQMLRNMVKRKTNLNHVENPTKKMTKFSNQTKQNINVSQQCIINQNNQNSNCPKTSYIDRIKNLHNVQLQKINKSINYGLKNQVKNQQKHQTKNQQKYQPKDKQSSNKKLAGKSYMKVSDLNKYINLDYQSSNYKINLNHPLQSSKIFPIKQDRFSQIDSPNYKLQMRNVAIVDSLLGTQQNLSLQKPTPLKPFEMLNQFISNSKPNFNNYEINPHNHTFNLNKVNTTPITTKLVNQFQKERNGLHQMYKTAQSINSSEEKDLTFVIQTNGESVKKGVNQYQRILLSNGYLYEGEISTFTKNMDGNGILYDGCDRVIYSGSWLDGLYHGFGTLNVYENIGNVNWKNLQGGWVKYEGQFWKGDRQGFGTMYLKSGQKFSGSFKKNMADGYGCFYLKDGDMVSGIWHNNCFRNL